MIVAVTFLLLTLKVYGFDIPAWPIYSLIGLKFSLRFVGLLLKAFELGDKE